MGQNTVLLTSLWGEVFSRWHAFFLSHNASLRETAVVTTKQNVHSVSATELLHISHTNQPVFVPRNCREADVESPS